MRGSDHMNDTATTFSRRFTRQNHHIPSQLLGKLPPLFGSVHPLTHVITAQLLNTFNLRKIDSGAIFRHHIRIWRRHSVGTSTHHVNKAVFFRRCCFGIR
uniref:Uncharacterized protein n=1 Tax=Kalanchoe fedtschenkoi TaxID=63787 RepID=A0A7N0RJS7_KALFE